MEKKLFTLLICAFAWIGVNATVTVSTDANGYTVVTTTTAGEISGDVTDSQTGKKVQELLSGVTKLKLVGPFKDNPDFNNLKGWCKPTHLDLTGAIIDQGTVTYTHYFLDTTDNQKNVRRVLTQDADGKWYYNLNGTNTYVDDEDVRIYTASVDGGQKIPSEWKSLTYISLPTSSSYNVVANQFCADFDNLKEIVIPDNIKVIGGQAFKSNNSQLTSVTLPNGLVAICKEAFYGTKLNTITIPGSVEIIEKDAFSNCTSATKLIFDESDTQHHMIIKYYAFYNLSALQDIYINTNALVDCENQAFDAQITWGQGATTRSLCTIHFSAEVGEHYANLTDPLTPTIAKNPKLFHEWLLAHYKKANTPYANGWWEFVKNGTVEENPDPVPNGKILRTFSDYDYDRIVPEGIKAYIVTGLEEQGDDYALKLVQLLVIPKRTGVILYGVPNSKDSKGNPIISMSLCEIANGLPLRRDYWYTLQGNDADNLKNYLWPSCVTLNPTKYVNENYVYYDMKPDGTIAVDEQGDYSVHVGVRKVLDDVANDVENNKKLPLGPWDNQTKFSTPNPETITPEGSTVSYTSAVPTGYDASVLNGFYRNFYLQRYANTVSGKKYIASATDKEKAKAASQYIGFFRCKSSKFGTGKAFLRVNSDEYQSANGGEAIIIGDTEKFRDAQGNVQNYCNYQVEYAKETGNPMSPDQSGLWKTGQNANPNMEWTDNSNWGNRTNATGTSAPAKFVTVTFDGEPEIIENEDGTATLIVPNSMLKKVGDNEYYSLQGIKVSNPTKGVYVKNGKKVVIK